MMTTTEKTIEQLQVELAAFDEAYLQEHGVYPALCDLPEHLIGVAGLIEQEQDDCDPNSPINELAPALSFDWEMPSNVRWLSDGSEYEVHGDTWLDMEYGL